MKVLSKNFSLLISGQVISVFGAAILRFALSLDVLDRTGRADVFATLLALSIVPGIILVTVVRRDMIDGFKFILHEKPYIARTMVLATDYIIIDEGRIMDRLTQTEKGVARSARHKGIIMKIVVLLVAVLLLILFSTSYVQFRGEIAAARQRVLEGSTVLTTEYGEIEYAVEGDGPAALLIHGAGGGYDQGMLIGKKALGDGYQFISVSRFGYLRSPLTETSTVEHQAALYAALLDHLEIDQAVILGASAGGPSALQFVHDYPDRSRGLVLLSAVTMFMGEEIPLSTKVINTIQKSDFSYWLVLKTFRPQFSEMIGIPQDIYEALSPEDKQYADDMLSFMHPMSPRYPGNIHEARIRPLSGEAMGTISVPTIILHAQDDSLVTFDHAVFANNSMRHSELVSFESGGHALVAETAVITDIISDFLTRNP